MILVGITGRARSGKDTIAKYLEKYHAFTLDSFAAPIRSMLVHTLGLKNLEELDSIKHIPNTILGGNTPRYAMQTIGTEWGRGMINDSIWIDSCIARIEKYDRAIISDVRFDNEAERIKNRGGVILKVHRTNEPYIQEADHASEQGIRADLVDYHIVNNETVDDLYANIERLMKILHNLKVQVK